MSAIHLSPKIYGVLQDFVHQGHRHTYRRIVELLDIRPGESVIEIGCGTGSVARHFIADGYDYWGFDPTADRIEAAQREIPGGHFVVGDALAIDNMDLPDARCFFVHGVLHHLSDEQVRRAMNSVFSRGRDKVIVVAEPIRPRRWWHNPFSTLLANLDEGDYVRTLEAWRKLFGKNLDVLHARSLWPRWPIHMLDARLVPAGARSADAVLDMAFASAE